MQGCSKGGEVCNVWVGSSSWERSKGPEAMQCSGGSEGGSGQEAINHNVRKPADSYL